MAQKAVDANVTRGWNVRGKAGILRWGFSITLQVSFSLMYP